MGEQPTVLAPPLPHRRRVTGQTILILAYSVVVLITTLRHEIWKDEAQAWLIACVSASPAALVERLAIEAHPPLWYLLLWVVSRCWQAVLAMQLLHTALAIAAVAIFVRWAPMRLWQKAMIVFGYYLVYEYAILARNYGVGVLLTFGVCALVAQRHRTMLWIGVLLALQANTSAQGAILAVGIGAGLVVDWLIGRKTARVSLAPAWHLIGAALICVAGLTASYLVVSQYPTDTPRITRTYEAPRDARDVVESFVPVSWALAPLQNAGWQPWGSHVLANHPRGAVRIAFALGGAAAAVGLLVVLLPKPALWTTAAVAGGGLWLLGTFVFRGYPRHYGHYFILLLAVLWLWHLYPSASGPAALAAMERAAARLRRPGAVLLTCLLAMHLIAGLQLVAVDLLWPFSRAKEVAAYLREHYPAGTLVMGYPDTESTAVAAQLGWKVFLLEEQDFGGPVNWVARGRTPADADPIRLAGQALQKHAANGEWAVLLVQVAQDPQRAQAIGVEIELQKRFSPGREQFVIYRARLVPRAGEEPASRSGRDLTGSTSGTGRNSVVARG